MDCPHGHDPMMQGRQNWICEECGHRVPVAEHARASTSPRNLPGLDRLPSILAIPLAEFATKPTRC